MAMHASGRRIRSNAEHDLKSPAAFRALFADDAHAIERTREVAARCTFRLDQIVMIETVGLAMQSAVEHVTLGSDGTIRLREHNCAILGAASGHPIACRAELQLFEEVLGARVVRTSHIAAGDRSCAYRIEPLDS